MGGQELSCCLGALARLGLPHRGAVPGLLARSAGRLSAFRNQEMLHLGWAAARLGYVPSEEWLSEFTGETFNRCEGPGPAACVKGAVAEDERREARAGRWRAPAHARCLVAWTAPPWASPDPRP
jgi:hypothetical protein